MVIEFNLVKNILKTLPIGYYLGRNIEVTLSTGEQSYFIPASDKIVIGYESIKRAFNFKTNNLYDYDLEEIIRGLLYHEISHVILTPSDLMSYVRNGYESILNIFEDERIETLLRSYYLNTNFKKNIIILNNYTEDSEPKNAEQAFYFVVRFHKGKKIFLNRVQDIISKYKFINAATTDYYIKNEYVKQIIDLYNAITRDFKQNPPKSNSQNQQSNNQNDNKSQNSNGNNSSNDEQNLDQQNSSNSSNDANNNSKSDNKSDDVNNEAKADSNKSDDSKLDSNSEENSSNSNEDSKNDDSSSNDDNSSNNGSSNDTTTTNSKAGDSSEETGNSAHKLTDQEVNDMIKELDVNIPDPDIKNLIRKAIEDTVDKYYDPQLTVKLKQMIENKCKQKNKNGAAISSYSGRFNVRAVATRDDYKWWAQQNRAGHIRMYSKVHFNLFIDNSGSFRNNDVAVNRFIQSLNTIKSSDFDFDVITINTHIEEWPSTTSKTFSSGGGTNLPREIEGVIKRHTQPRTNNYNIVLFDGDADPDRVGSSNAFKFFDTPNTIIVTDSENSRHIDNAGITKARVIITRNYCTQFINSVITLMEQTI